MLRLVPALLVVLLALRLTPPARADDLGALQDRVAADLVAGRPLVVQVHVPLCSNEILRCGGHGLGDGDDPGRNLYWATSGGFRGWYGRRGSGWTELAAGPATDPGVLEQRIWRRRIVPGPVWRSRGVVRPFFVYVVASAWRGMQIDRAVTAYLDDLHRPLARPVVIPGGTLDAGGAAQIVAYVGHNRWMDVDTDWAGVAAAPAGAAKGTIALACKSAAYLAEHVVAPGRVPLLMTRDFLFSGAHAFDGAVSTFAEGGSLAAIRLGAARRYAEGQGKPLGRVLGAFTNPADARWRAARAVTR